MSLFERFNVKRECEDLSVAIPAIPAIPKNNNNNNFCNLSDLDIWNAIQSGKLVSIWSPHLKERVIWVRDAEVQSRVQAKHPDIAVYTLREIETLVQQKCNADQLRGIHLAKKMLGGAISDSPDN